MAHAHISPPEKFDFKQPMNFEKWIRRFDRYLTVAEIKNDERKINTLVYCMGNHAEDILLTFNLSEEDAKKYDAVRDAFKKHFVVRKNVIFERARFNRRTQQDGESIEMFITELYALIEHCEYGDKENELLRDRIVVGIRDTKLSETLQMDDKLTLEKCLEKVRSKELIETQSSLLQQTQVSTDYVKSRKSKSKTTKSSANWKSSAKSQMPKKTPKRKICYRCGKDMHKLDDCPAKNDECSKCGMIGHWRKYCRSKNIGELETDDADDDNFLGVVTSVQVTEVTDSPWDIELSTNGRKLMFKIDCGADVTVIGKRDYIKVAEDIPLRKSDKVLIGASSQPLKTLGMMECELVNNSDHVTEKVYVVDKLNRPLLGKPAITSLKLLTRTNEVKTDPLKKRILDKFPKLFTGLGTLEGEYDIKLSPQARPVSIKAPRRIAQPLLQKTKECLDKMIADGVVRKLNGNEVSEWCSGMVVVPKPGGKVRICVDLTELNKHIIRPRYSLPTVDETLSKLGKGAVFTKLDANSGFFQCRLSEKSQLLTSFLTPWGRYCYAKLPFGVSSGPEVYSDRMNEILEGMKNTACIVDDICVFSEKTENHEEYLFPVLQKLQDAGATLNPDKCEFMQPSITFVGHKISGEGISADENKIRAINEMPNPTCLTELRRFLGMVNQMSKFSSNLAELTHPLRALLSKNNTWFWGPEQESAFAKVKEEMCSSRVLAKYDPTFETKIRSDSSSVGYGAVLLQRQSPKHDYRPVYYASKSLSQAEQRYSIVEKEAGALAWACRKFDQYILGMDNLKIEVDQKSLVSLLGKKSLDTLPPRIVRFRLAMMRYKYEISHVPGKELCTSDCLSRASISDSQPSPLHDETEHFINVTP